MYVFLLLCVSLVYSVPNFKLSELAFTYPTNIGQKVASIISEGDDTNVAYVVSGSSSNYLEVRDKQLYFKVDSWAASLIVDINATDSTGRIQNTFTLQPNLAPSAIQLSTLLYTPSSPTNTLVGTLSAIDANVGQAITFSLTRSGSSSFYVSGNQLWAYAGTKGNNLLLDVTATDSLGAAYSRGFYLNELKVAPTDIRISSSTYAPPSVSGTVIGTLSAVDANTQETYTFTISAGDTNIIENVGTSLRFKTSGVGIPTIWVEIYVYDSANLYFVKNITIKSINVPPTSISLWPDFYVPPSTTDVVVGTLTGTDPNVEQTLTFQVTGGRERWMFTVVSGNILRIPFPKLVSNYNQVEITADDGNGGKLSRNLTVYAANIPPSDLILSTNKYTPPSTEGGVMATLSTVDINPEQVHTYTVVSQNPTNVFATSGNKLIFRGSGEGRSTLSVTLLVADGAGGNYTKTFTITANNVAPTAVAIRNPGYYGPPSTVNMVVGDIYAVDPNSDQTHTFRITGGTHASLFTIAGTNQLIFVTAGERRTGLQVTVEANDGNGGITSRTLTIVTINVPPTDIFLTGSQTYIPESVDGYLIGNLSAFDPNLDDKVTFSLQSSLPINALRVVGSQLFTGPGFRDNTLWASITATDNGGMKFTKRFAINAVNVGPHSLTLSSSRYSSPTPYANYPVARIMAKDRNNNDTLTYTISGGAQQSLFAINKSNLVIVRAGETRSPLLVDITVTDGRGGSLTKSFSLTVGICPAGGWIPGPQFESCYLINHVPVTYDQAVAACNANKFSKLVSIDSEDEHNYVRDLVFPNNTWISDCSSLYYMGFVNRYCAWLNMPEINWYKCRSSDGFNTTCNRNHKFICEARMGSPPPSGWLFREEGSIIRQPGQVMMDDILSDSSLLVQSYSPTRSTSFTRTLAATSKVDLFVTVNNLTGLENTTIGLTLRTKLGYASIFTGTNMVWTTWYPDTRFNIDKYVNEVVTLDYIPFVSEQLDPVTKVLRNVTTMLPKNITSYVPYNLTRVTNETGYGIPIRRPLPTWLALWRRGDSISFGWKSSLNDQWKSAGQINIPISEPFTVGLELNNPAQETAALVSNFALLTSKIGIVSLSPELGAIEVSTSTSLTITFDRNITLGPTGNITLIPQYNPSDRTQGDPIYIPVNMLVASGTTLTTSSLSLRSSTSYFVVLSPQLVLDRLSMDIFDGWGTTPNIWTFVTSPTQSYLIEQGYDISIGLKTDLEQWDNAVLCRALKKIWIGFNCNNIVVRSVTAGSVVVRFYIQNVVVGTLDSLLTLLQQAYQDGSLAAAFNTEGIGLIQGTLTTSGSTSDLFSSMTLTLTPDTPGSQTTAIATVVTTTGLPKSGRIEFGIAYGFSFVSDTSQIQLTLSVLGSAYAPMVFVADSVLNNVATFTTNWPWDISLGNQAQLRVTGIVMPSNCMGINNWLWSIRFYDADSSQLFNYGTFNPTTDTCNGERWTQKNTAPKIGSLKTFQWTYEDMQFTFSDPIVVTDDARSSDILTVTLSLSNPKAQIRPWPPERLYQVPTLLNGSLDSSFMIFKGTPFQIQYALANLNYTPSVDYYGVDWLTVLVNDNGYCCDDRPLSTSFLLPIYVVGVNDPPVLKGSALSPIILEDTNGTFSFEVNDVDAMFENIQVEITAKSGTWAFTTTLDPSITCTPADTTIVVASRKCVGPQQKLNLAFKTLMFFPNLDFYGDAIITGLANDLGQGPYNVTAMNRTFTDLWGDKYSKIVTVTIKVKELLDRPYLRFIGTGNELTPMPIIDEDTFYDFHLLTLDSDAGTKIVSTDIVSIYGSISSLTPGLTVTQGYWNFQDGFSNLTRSSSWPVYHVAGQAQAFINGTLRYRPQKDWYGDDYLLLVYTNNEPGVGISRAYNNFTIRVNPVNDPPAFYTKFTNLTFNVDDIWTKVNVDLYDVDASNGTLSLTISSNRGGAEIYSHPALTVKAGNVSGGDGTTIRVEGPLFALREALKGLRFRSTTPRYNPIYHIVDSYFDSSYLVLTANDNGNSGKGGPMESEIIFNFYISATLYPTCDSYLKANSMYCGCYYRSQESTKYEYPWTKLPTSFPSKVMIDTNYPRKFMQGCCSDLAEEYRNQKLLRIAELGLCTKEDL